MKTFMTYSFGCRVNQAEMEALSHELVRRGYEEVDTNPYMYIINTCSVTHKAEREARSHISHIRNTYPNTQIIVTGCAATNWIKLNKKPQDADHVIDNGGKEHLAEMIHTRIKPFSVDAKTISGESIHLDSIPTPHNDLLAGSKRVMIKIQDGCHRFCSFCIVPYLRGLPRSKSIDSIIAEINRYPDFQEAILAAINTEAFGRDTGEKFEDLICQVLLKTRIPRLSFGSIHPWTLTDAFLKTYEQLAHEPRFVDFFHIPLQSGCDKILALMKRGYTREDILHRLKTLHSINPDVFIATDVIAGFLEETDADFEETYDFLERSPISRFHVFRYSPREHTASYYLGKRLTIPSSETAKKRSARLRALSTKKMNGFMRALIGKQFSALYLLRTITSDREAVLSNNVPIRVQDGVRLQPGSIGAVHISDFQNGTLFGTIVT